MIAWRGWVQKELSSWNMNSWGHLFNIGGDVRTKALPIRFGKTRAHLAIETRFTSVSDRIGNLR